jgi:hypothetical protein
MEASLHTFCNMVRNRMASAWIFSRTADNFLCSTSRVVM